MRCYTLLILALLLCSGAFAQLTPSEKTYGLCAVKSYGYMWCRCTGTGFWIDQTHVMTARHVVLPARSGITVTGAGGYEMPAAVESIGPDASCDYAVLCVQNTDTVKPLPLARTVGNPACLFAYRDSRIDGEAIETSGGSLRPELNWDSWRLITSCDVRGGYSGSPVVDPSGKVVGVQSIFFPTAHMSGFVPIQKIREHLGW